MGLIDALRAGVKAADTVTKSLQSDVTYERYLSENEYADKTYAAAVTLKALVDWRQRQVRTVEGVLSVSRASITFIDVAALAAATGGLGIADNDKIVLPDGTTGPILDMSGFIDPGTGEPLATEVFIG